MASIEQTRQDIPTDARAKPLRFKIGIGLLILYPLMLLFAAVVPFLPVDVATKAAIVGADLAAAEVVFVVAVACVGKETIAAIKARFRRRRNGGATAAADDE